MAHLCVASFRLVKKYGIQPRHVTKQTKAPRAWVKPPDEYSTAVMPLWWQLGQLMGAGWGPSEGMGVPWGP